MVMLGAGNPAAGRVSWPVVRFFDESAVMPRDMLPLMIPSHLADLIFASIC